MKNAVASHEIKLKSVHDGDTIIVDIHLGFGFWMHDQKIRLARINAPELKLETENGEKIENQPGLEALSFLSCKMEHARVKEYPMWIETTYKKEKYGRWLCEVFFFQSGATKKSTKTKINVSDMMLENGHAAEYRGFNIQSELED